ncbi:MAG: hypothetical protein HYZ34_10460, partial [Ignavibacteriae bacterium]|nr:hypothetical protein [Ignavibacteriota bacterium]
MSIKDKIIHEIDELNTTELTQLSNFVDYLKYKSNHKLSQLNEKTVAKLYKEFEDE